MGNDMYINNETLNHVNCIILISDNNQMLAKIVSRKKKTILAVLNNLYINFDLSNLNDFRYTTSLSLKSYFIISDSTTIIIYQERRFLNDKIVRDVYINYNVLYVIYVLVRTYITYAAYNTGNKFYEIY